MEFISNSRINPKLFYVIENNINDLTFLKLPKGRRFGVDLEPKHPEVRQMNFFDTSREVMDITEETPLALIGNPPFGDVASAFFVAVSGDFVRSFLVDFM